MYFLYILECGDHSLYTGITTDLKRRFKEHQNKQGGHYTRARKVLRVVYTESYKDRSSASKRELEVKGWKRSKKLELAKLAKRNH
ncbi:MAG: GIY-YIG nuclease family protein [Candidatus Paceibacterota bacterium]|jgi:putative endonuclease